jgi:PE family
LYQAVTAHAAAIRELIASNLAALGGSYAAAEAANAIAAG